MANIEEGEIKSAILISDWRLYDLEPSLLPEGHNVAYTCEIVGTRPDLPTASDNPTQIFPGSSRISQQVFIMSNETPGQMAQRVRPRSTEG
jgi:hypothetical protein